jgi:hypothetical protein
MIGEAADTKAGQKAVQLELATKAIHAKEMIAKESSLVILPDGATDAGTMVSQAMAIIQKITNSTSAEISSKPETTRDTAGPWDTAE